jgi:hypothetical protein
MGRLRFLLGAPLLLASTPYLVLAQVQTPPQPRTILAIGAHAGDMELTAGQLLTRQRK